jgi:NADH:ubiquinone oxidoreductase subunit 4 (subunit M)
MWYLILVDNELESISIMLGKNNIRWDGITVLMWIIVWVMTRIIKSLISNKILSSIVIVSMGLSFSIIDILYFTICYEWVIIRITMLIITSGSSRKKDGVIKLLYFTLVSSICLIVVIVTNIISYGGTDALNIWL